MPPGARAPGQGPQAPPRQKPKPSSSPIAFPVADRRHVASTSLPAGLRFARHVAAPIPQGMPRVDSESPLVRCAVQARCASIEGTNASPARSVRTFGLVRHPNATERPCTRHGRDMEQQTIANESENPPPADTISAPSVTECSVRFGSVTECSAFGSVRGVY